VDESVKLVGVLRAVLGLLGRVLLRADRLELVDELAVEGVAGDR
jgi:hypothetical protein